MSVILRLDCNVEGKTTEYIECDKEEAKIIQNAFEFLKKRVEFSSLNGGDPEFRMDGSVFLTNLSNEQFCREIKDQGYECVDHVYTNKTDLFDSMALYSAQFMFNVLFKYSKTRPSSFQKVTIVFFENFESKSFAFGFAINAKHYKNHAWINFESQSFDKIVRLFQFVTEIISRDIVLDKNFNLYQVIFE
jgi:hypothetical protein